MFTYDFLVTLSKLGGRIECMSQVGKFEHHLGHPLSRLPDQNMFALSNARYRHNEAVYRYIIYSFRSSVEAIASAVRVTNMIRTEESHESDYG
jgi:hypothetical protein